MKFICNQCKREYTEQEARWKCDCGGALSCDFTPSFTKHDIKTNRFNMWRYDAAYPLKYEDLTVTFDEGMTPLVKVPHAKCHLRVKMEYLMPTGSFKDRGTVMVVNYLLNQGVRFITEDSSGNAGASVAGYCALGQIPCEIYVPKGNSAGKLIQIRAYGANIHEISGSREDVAAAAQEHSDSYAGHNWHPMFLQGTKSAAYELWEQNGFEAPDNIVAVAGNGSSILGMYYGFRELLQNGQVTKLPRLFVIQAEHCNPIYREFVGDTSVMPAKPTVAEGIALRNPNKSSLVTAAVRQTGGTIISVTETQIIKALKQLAALGLYAEPTSAAAYAGLCQLLDHGILTSHDDIVMTLSGNGLKAGQEIAELYTL